MQTFFAYLIASRKPYSILLEYHPYMLSRIPYCIGCQIECHLECLIEQFVEYTLYDTPIYPVYVADFHLKYAVEYLVEDRLYMIPSYNIPLEYPYRLPHT